MLKTVHTVFAHLQRHIMPLTYRVPSYRKHCASGQAVVTLNGKDHYLGLFGTAVSKRQYDMLIAQWIAGGRRIQEAPQDITIGEIVLLYVKHATEYYRRADGLPTGVHERVIWRTEAGLASFRL